MKHALLILLASAGLSISLTACDMAEYEAGKQRERNTDVARIQRQVPAGCAFRDLGTYHTEYQGTVPVLAIFCGQTTTTETTYRSGKSTRVISLTTTKGDAQ